LYLGTKVDTIIYEHQKNHTRLLPLSLNSHINRIYIIKYNENIDKSKKAFANIFYDTKERIICKYFKDSECCGGILLTNKENKVKLSSTGITKSQTVIIIIMDHKNEL
jgi:hypothetical protein